MSDVPGEVEGRPGIGRIEAFSDGVIAIIVTIMVLELHGPVAEGMGHLLALWPIFFAYVLSYGYVAIYWVNHHRLFSHARIVTNGLLWANILLLFSLSLIPFTTSYLGEHHFSRNATWLYLASTLFPAVAYTWLHSVVRRTGRQDTAARLYYRIFARKGAAANLLYLAGVPLTAISPWLGIACAVLVGILWCVPKSPLDRYFEPASTSDQIAA